VFVEENRDAQCRVVRAGWSEVLFGTLFQEVCFDVTLAPPTHSPRLAQAYFDASIPSAALTVEERAGQNYMRPSLKHKNRYRKSSKGSAVLMTDNGSTALSTVLNF
jgi:hypothetical protein